MVGSSQIWPWAKGAHTLKMLRWQAAGKMTETEIVRKEPMRDMTYARNGTKRAAIKQPPASAVRTRNLRIPAGQSVWQKVITSHIH